MTDVFTRFVSESREQFTTTIPVVGIPDAVLVFVSTDPVTPISASFVLLDAVTLGVVDTTSMINASVVVPAIPANKVR